MIELAISNSSAFIGLGRIGRLDILKATVRRVCVPQAVLGELGKVPDWVDVVHLLEPRLIDCFPVRIHKGEAEVILLGMKSPGAVLILDDWYARHYAVERGIQVVGTVGLLLRAKQIGATPLVAPILHELVQAGFRVSAGVLQEALKLAEES